MAMMVVLFPAAEPKIETKVALSSQWNSFILNEVANLSIGHCRSWSHLINLVKLCGRAVGSVVVRC